MAFKSTGLVLMAEGFANGAPRIWIYASPDAVDALLYSTVGSSYSYGTLTDNPNCVTQVGYFRGVGELSHGYQAAGMRVGDIVHCRLSPSTTSGFPPGMVSTHSVIASTLNIAGNAYDCTLSDTSV